MTFDEFYRAYPRHVGRLDAEKAWRQMTARGYEPAEIVKGATKFAQQCASEGKDRQYIPYPASWLRAGRWMDDELIETVKPEPIVRPARSIDELKAFYRSIGKPVTAEIERARSVEELPSFAKMIPAGWPNVVPMKRGA